MLKGLSTLNHLLKCLYVIHWGTAVCHQPLGGYVATAYRYESYGRVTEKGE